MKYKELYSKLCNYLNVIACDYKIKKNQRIMLFGLVLHKAWSFTDIMVHVQDV